MRSNAFMEATGKSPAVYLNPRLTVEPRTYDTKVIYDSIYVTAG